MPNDTRSSKQVAKGNYNAQANGPGATASVSIGQRITNLFVGDTAQRAQRNRRAMLEAVKSIWIKGVMEKSLYCEVLIELGLEERADAVERPWDMVVQMPNCPRRTLPPGVKIVDVFGELGCALLILGEPGSGKTTTLLELARDLIARAEEDPTQPIPVVFNLSSWTGEQAIANWLVDELIAKYYTPKKVARSWVEDGDLLPLLDGLDEVKPENREACVKAINDFRASHGQLAVCSRIADYEALTMRLKLQGAVLLQPLMPGQIDEYFEGVGAELAAVRQVLQSDTVLQELAQSPLMLSIMALAYRGMSIEAIVGEQASSVEARRKRLFDIYIQQMFSRVGRSKKELYPQAQTKRWLAWLARKMLEHTQSVFLIEQMQPSWLETSAQVWLYACVFGLTIVPGGMGIIGISAWRIVPVERLKWSRDRVIKDLIIVLGTGLIFGLIFGLMSGLRACKTITSDF